MYIFIAIYKNTELNMLTKYCGETKEGVSLIVI